MQRAPTNTIEIPFQMEKIHDIYCFILVKISSILVFPSRNRKQYARYWKEEPLKLLKTRVENTYQSSLARFQKLPSSAPVNKSPQATKDNGNFQTIGPDNLMKRWTLPTLRHTESMTSCASGSATMQCNEVQ